jgi:hypothetical protein
VAYGMVSRQRPQNKHLYNSRWWVMAPPTDMNATTPLKQRSNIFYAVCADML